MVSLPRVAILSESAIPGLACTHIVYEIVQMPHIFIILGTESNVALSFIKWSDSCAVQNFQAQTAPFLSICLTMSFMVSSDVNGEA